MTDWPMAINDIPDLTTTGNRTLSKRGSIHRGDDKATMMQKARTRAEELEGVFLSEMLKPMFDNIKAAEPFGGGFGEDVWQSMQQQEYGKAIARQGGIGLADTITQELLRNQEEGSGGKRTLRSTRS